MNYKTDQKKPASTSKNSSQTPRDPYQKPVSDPAQNPRDPIGDDIKNPNQE